MSFLIVVLGVVAAASHADTVIKGEDVKDHGNDRTNVVWHIEGTDLVSSKVDVATATVLGAESLEEPLGGLQAQMEANAVALSPRRSSKSRRRSSRRRRKSSRRRKSPRRRRRRSKPSEPTPAPVSPKISQEEWEIFAQTNKLMMNYNGHFCATGGSVYPPRCVIQGSTKDCVVGGKMCIDQGGQPFCNKLITEPLLFDCRLWRAAKAWNTDGKGQWQMDGKWVKRTGKNSQWQMDETALKKSLTKIKAQGISTLAGFRVNQIEAQAPANAFKQLREGYPAGKTLSCHNMGNPKWNVQKLSAVGLSGGFWVQLFSSEDAETVDQSCLPAR